MIAILSQGIKKLFPIRGDLSVVSQTGAISEGKFEIGRGDWKVVRMILPLIKMDLLSVHHRIRTLTGQTGAVSEGVVEREC